MLFRKTVDSILADVIAKIDQLQALAVEAKANAEKARDIARGALIAAEAEDQEADRALRISAKIEELVS